MASFLFFFESEFVYRSACDEGTEAVTRQVIYVLCLSVCVKETELALGLAMGDSRV